MLTISELRDYASIRKASFRDIEAYCNLSAGHISNIFNGTKQLTESNHDEIVRGINRSYAAKLRGDFTRPPLDSNRNAIKPNADQEAKPEAEPAAKTETKPATKSSTKSAKKPKRNSASK